MRTSGKTRCAPLPAPLQCPGREGCTVVADLEQHCGQGLDISLWHFQGSWLLGAQREPGWVVKSGGTTGLLPCSGGGVVGTRAPSGDGAAHSAVLTRCLLLCTQIVGWGWLIQYLRLSGEDSKEEEMWFLPLRSLPPR